MKIALLPTLLLTAPLAAGQGIVEINEIRIDQPSGDVDEYVELRGATDTVLDGLTYLVIGDGTGGSGVVESVTPLSGTIGASGYFVVAESTFTLGTADLVGTLDFENGDNVTHLVVSGFTGAKDDDLDVDDDGVLDTTPWTAIEDCVALIEEVGAGDLVYCADTVGPDGTFVPGHVYDCASGGWTIGVFDPVGGEDTPGADNSFCSAPPVVVSINEVRIDQPSSDDDEYVELLGTPGEVLDGLAYIVIGDGTGGSGVVESVTDLTGFVVPASGYTVLAEATFTLGVADYVVDLNFENGDNVTHLVVRDFTGISGDDLDTDDDGVLDVTPWSEVVDCIALLEEVGAGDLVYCTETVGPDGTFVPGHAYACDTGGWAIGLFDPVGGLDTPGAANPSCEPPPVAVGINELRIDQPSSDDDEYVELTGNPGDVLDGLTYVVIGDGAGGSGVVENVTDLAGVMIGASGKTVLAEATFTIGAADYVVDLNFENGDNVTHLVVRDFTGVIDEDLDTDDDGVLDVTPWSEVVDCIALLEEVGGGDQVYCTETVGPDGTFVPAHAYLCDDGWRIGAFDPAGGNDTPGEDNDCDPDATFEIYCVSFPNSVSTDGAKIGWTGTGSIADNDTVLTVTDCPDTFGIFLMSDAEDFQAPFFNGVLCLGGSLIRLNPIVKATGNQNSRALDFFGSGPENQIQAGQTWYFQYFYRDAGQGADNNLSDALKATFAN